MEPDLDQFNRRERQPVSGLSMTAMILGIVSFPAICCGLLGAPIPIGAVICGHLGIKDIKDNPEKVGKGLAITGLILGYLLIFLVVAFYMWWASMSPEEMEEVGKWIEETISRMGPELWPDQD